MEPRPDDGDVEPLTPAERQFLLESGVPADSFHPGARESARAALRRRAEETARKASPELTVADVAALLDCDQAQVIEWAASRTLYSFRSGDALLFPEWQFPDGQRLPGLASALRELGPATHPYSVEGLLAVVPHEELDDMTAVEWLAHGGDVDPVVALVVSDSYGM